MQQSLYTDDVHPSKAGTFLAACTIYGAITGQRTTGFDQGGSTLSPELRETLQQVAAATVTEFESRVTNVRPSLFPLPSFFFSKGDVWGLSSESKPLKAKTHLLFFSLAFASHRLVAGAAVYAGVLHHHIHAPRWTGANHHHHSHHHYG